MKRPALFALLALSACTAPKPVRPDARAEGLERRLETLLEERSLRDWQEPAPVR